MEIDRDLQSIQEVRSLIRTAKKAQEEFASFGQQKTDSIVKSIAEACAENAEKLAKMAEQETGFGRWQDKTLKNILGSTVTYKYIRNMKTRGIIRDDTENGIIEIGTPVGIIAALIPSTNPTSTVMYKSLISVKAGNAVIFSPHPSARSCILETVKIIQNAAVKAGAPEGLIGCIQLTTPEATSALLKDNNIGLILATGGEPMVHAAYSSGNPAIGVGPGNGPSYIEKTADIKNAVRHIIDSKTFDNGTICASEQSIITENEIAAEVERELKAQGAYFMSGEESEKLAGILLRANGSMNPAIVGKSAVKIAEMAGLSILGNTRVLISRQAGTVSAKNPFNREKLCPVLAYYVEENWQSACERSIEILNVEGIGHTMTIHSTDSHIIREFALKKPVSRLLVNTPGALGGVGATTNLPPAFTLGCGAVGGSASSDNITPLNLINIRRVAIGKRELYDLRMQYQPEEAGHVGHEITENTKEDDEELMAGIFDDYVLSDKDIADIVSAVKKRICSIR